VGYKCQTKLLGGLGKFFTTVKSKVINFAKNNSLVKPRYYLTTPEGMILKASHDVENIGAVSKGVVNPSFVLLETTYAKVAVELKKEIEFLQKKYNYVRNGMSELAHKKIKMDYEHILGMDINQSKKGKLNIRGFHHDFNNIIEKSNVLEFANKVIDKHGCYKARVLNQGDFVKNITFFPAHWTREKVISKIYEAYNNFKEGVDVLELKSDGKYLMRCVTNEGIEIEIFVTKNGLITTVYPTMKLGE